MHKVESIGNLPRTLKMFLFKPLPGEHAETDVYDCKFDELINRCKQEKLEPQVIIDRKDTGRSFLVAVGASVRSLDDEGTAKKLKPVMYFAELDEERKRAFIQELAEARAKVLADAQAKKEAKDAQRERYKERGENN